MKKKTIQRKITQLMCQVFKSLKAGATDVASLDISHKTVRTRVRTKNRERKQCTNWDCVQLLQERRSLEKGMPRVGKKEEK